MVSITDVILTICNYILSLRLCNYTIGYNKSIEVTMPGKKAKDPNDQKKKILQIRLSEADLLTIKNLARDRGMSVSDLIRSIVILKNAG